MQEQVRQRILRKFQDRVYTLEEVSCYCGESNGHEIALRDRYGFEVRTLLCMRCGLFRTSPRMTAESTQAFYLDDYRALYTDGRMDLLSFHEFCLRRGRNIIDTMPNLLARIDTVFDIGCASGGMLEAFSKHGKRVTGCDVNPEYLRFGRARGLDLVEGETEELLIHTGYQADLVILSHVMEHFLDLRNGLESVFSAVREDGFALVIVPSIETVATDYQGDLLRYFQNAHTYHFSAATLRYVLESVGMNVIAVQPDGAALVMRPKGWQTGRTYDVSIPKQAAMENMALVIKLETGFARERSSRSV
jgi:SAM-dependent methyltransferase